MTHPIVEDALRYYHYRHHGKSHDVRETNRLRLNRALDCMTDAAYRQYLDRLTALERAEEQD